MSVQVITHGFERIHNIFVNSLNLSTSGGDLAIGIAFSIFCQLLKSVSKTLKPKLEYGDVEKFHEVVYKIIIRTWFTYYSINLCITKDYFWDTSLYWRNADGTLRENLCRRDIMIDERIYYVTLFGYYVNHTFTQFSDPHRKDFLALCAHHVVTLCLIVMSYKSGYSSIGVVVAMCHEPSDLLLACAKLFRYLGMKATTDILFIIFTISWFYSRLYLYPLKCILATGFGPWRLFYHDFLPVPVDEPPNCINLSVDFLFSLLLVLYLLQVYWTFFLVQAIARKLSSGNLEDTRSDKEEIPAGGFKVD